jgi:hypothetical protein
MANATTRALLSGSVRARGALLRRRLRARPGARRLMPRLASAFAYEVDRTIKGGLTADAAAVAGAWATFTSSGGQRSSPPSATASAQCLACSAPRRRRDEPDPGLGDDRDGVRQRERLPTPDLPERMSMASNSPAAVYRKAHDAVLNAALDTPPPGLDESSAPGPGRAWSPARAQGGLRRARPRAGRTGRRGGGGREGTRERAARRSRPPGAAPARGGVA